MADISDVESALRDAIVSAIYPTGTSNPSSIGAATRVYRGWPNAAALDLDLKAGIVNVSVYSRPGMERNVSRYPVEWVPGIISVPTITVAVLGDTVTLGGAAGVKQNIGIRTDAGAYVVQAQPTDTPSTVAADFRALIPGATGSGLTVTLSPSTGLFALTGGTGTAQAEVMRLTAGVQIDCWCPNPALRDVTASYVITALAQLPFIPLSDGTSGRLIYHNSTSNDRESKDALWRRCITYSVEYPVTAQQIAAQMLFGGGNYDAGTTGTVHSTYGDVYPGT